MNSVGTGQHRKLCEESATMYQKTATRSPRKSPAGEPLPVHYSGAKHLSLDSTGPHPQPLTGQRHLCPHRQPGGAVGPLNGSIALKLAPTPRFPALATPVAGACVQGLPRHGATGVTPRGAAVGGGVHAPSDPRRPATSAAVAARRPASDSDGTRRWPVWRPTRQPT